MGHQVFMYRRTKDGEIEAKIFDSEEVPARHWVDDPAKCKAEKPIKANTKKAE